MIKTERFAQVQVQSAEDLHRWMKANHAQLDSVWLVTFKNVVIAQSAPRALAPPCGRQLWGTASPNVAPKAELVHGGRDSFSSCELRRFFQPGRTTHEAPEQWRESPGSSRRYRLDSHPGASPLG